MGRAAHMRQYRIKLKENDPEKYAEYLRKQRERAAMKRQAFKEEPFTRAKQAKIEAEREKLRLRKQASRARLRAEAGITIIKREMPAPGPTFCGKRPKDMLESELLEHRRRLQASLRSRHSEEKKRMIREKARLKMQECRAAAKANKEQESQIVTGVAPNSSGTDFVVVKQPPVDDYDEDTLSMPGSSSPSHQSTSVSHPPNSSQAPTVTSQAPSCAQASSTSNIRISACRSYATSNIGISAPRSYATSNIGISASGSYASSNASTAKGIPATHVDKKSKRYQTVKWEIETLVGTLSPEEGLELLEDLLDVNSQRLKAILQKRRLLKLLDTAREQLVNESYPFSDPDRLDQWVATLSEEMDKGKQAGQAVSGVDVGESSTTTVSRQPHHRHQPMLIIVKAPETGPSTAQPTTEKYSLLNKPSTAKIVTLDHIYAGPPSHAPHKPNNV